MILAALLQQLHALDAVEAGVEADAFIYRVLARRALGVLDLDRGDLVLEGTALGRGDGALVTLVGILVELVLVQPVLLGDHLGAGELAELDVRITLFLARALGHAKTVLGRQDNGEAHRHAGHALDAGGDDDVLRPAHHRLGGEMQRLLRGPALTVDARARHAFRQA